MTPPPAVVLVGGEGTRLRPLTLHTPKQMLPVAGIPLLRRVLEPLEAAGIDEVVLSSGYRAEAFDGLDLSPFRVTHAVETHPLGSGGGLANALRTAEISGTFVALNGDVIGNVDVASMLQFHRDSGARATILVKAVPDPAEFGVAVVAADGTVERFVEKPPPPAPSDLVNAGVWILDSSILSGVAASAPCSIEREIFPDLAQAGELRAFRHEGWWHDVGRLDRYLAATFQCVDAGQVPAEWQLSSGVLTAPDAQVDPSARLIRSVIGPRSKVKAGALVADSVLLDGATVGPDAEVRGSIVGPGWSVGEAEVVVDAICADPEGGSE
ncbi:MAG: NDP-sugar synthase [Actinobacteria bacterium]|nr:NDP-sugar synthase [Actinomycetota bacterium]